MEKNLQCQENVAQSAFKTTTVKYLKVFLYLCRAFCSLSLNLEVLDCLALIISSLLSCILVTLPVDQKFPCFIPLCLFQSNFFLIGNLAEFYINSNFQGFWKRSGKLLPQPTLLPTVPLLQSLSKPSAPWRCYYVFTYKPSLELKHKNS